MLKTTNIYDECFSPKNAAVLRIFSFVVLLTLHGFCSAGGPPYPPVDSRLEEDNQNSGSIPPWISNSGQALIKGIAEGPYKKPGWREYLVRDRIELEVDYPPGPMPHPRLLTPLQIRQAAISLSTDPQRKWYRQVRSNATQSAILGRRKARQIAEQAKSCAFVYRMEGNPYYLNQAISLLRLLPEPPGIVNLEGGNAEGRWGDYLQSAEAIPDLCVACDLLYNELPDIEKREIERKIAGVVRQLAEGFQVTPRNNHVTVMAVAVATAALTFDNLQQFIPYSSRDLFRLAVDHLSQSLSLIAPDGGYGEGPCSHRVKDLPLARALACGPLPLSG